MRIKLKSEDELTSEGWIKDKNGALSKEFNAIVFYGWWKEKLVGTVYNVLRCEPSLRGTSILYVVCADGIELLIPTDFISEFV